MAKIHTRIKRRLGLSTHLRHYLHFHPGTRRSRPKTFATEETANKWAAEHNLGPEQYFLKPAKNNKKFTVVIKNGQNKNSADKKNNKQTHGTSQR